MYVSKMRGYKMLKKYSYLLLTVVCSAIFFMCGCMSVDCVIVESFPPTEDVKKFEKNSDIPYEYTVIGVCQTEGNYTEYSYDDMMNKIIERGRENGADAVLLVGMRVVPDGRVVQTSPLVNSIEATSAASANTWEEIGKDFGGGYGSIRSKSFGTAQTYDRIVRARLIRFVRNEKGEFVPRKKAGEDITEKIVPLKKMKEIKKEVKNAKAD